MYVPGASTAGNGGTPGFHQWLQSIQNTQSTGPFRLRRAAVQLEQRFSRGWCVPAPYVFSSSKDITSNTMAQRNRQQFLDPRDPEATTGHRTSTYRTASSRPSSGSCRSSIAALGLPAPC